MRAESTRANAAIEFALVAPVFFLLLLAIVEDGVIYFAGSTLQYATDNAARYVRTGQAQGAALTQGQFRQRICNDIGPVLQCNANLQVDLESFSGYGGATFTNPLDANGNVNSSLNNYQAGTSCNVVLLRVFYTWNIITPMLSPFLTNMATGKHLITATAAFRNEPFTSTVSGC
ncbi:MAG: pilus assembly protein [Alphaproteobacteria bacterium]|nr:pilus assembly protein [Alphaproteobacteria bacterium]MBL6937519.1 pilus assembly protein [Alphaproteobacteria bacterium]MBL7098857.1 pilus assembly protein [Alphaproteobacteria bacterium]